MTRPWGLSAISLANASPSSQDWTFSSYWERKKKTIIGVHQLFVVALIIVGAVWIHSCGDSCDGLTQVRARGTLMSTTLATGPVWCSRFFFLRSSFLLVAALAVPVRVLGGAVDLDTQAVVAD